MQLMACANHLIEYAIIAVLLTKCGPYKIYAAGLKTQWLALGGFRIVSKKWTDQCEV